MLFYSGGAEIEHKPIGRRAAARGHPTVDVRLVGEVSFGDRDVSRTLQPTQRIRRAVGEKYALADDGSYGELHDASSIAKGLPAWMACSRKRRYSATVAERGIRTVPAACVIGAGTGRSMM